MTIAFPRTLPTELVSRLLSCTFDLVYTQDMAPTRGGSTIVRDLGPALWHATFQTANLDPIRFKAVESWLDSLGGAVNPFYAYDLQRSYAENYPNGYSGLVRANSGGAFDGTALLAAVATDNVTLTLGSSGAPATTLPVGFVLNSGDYIAFDYNSGASRALHRVTYGGGGTSDSNGVLAVEVRPQIRAGWTGASALLATPSGKFLVAPNSVKKSPQAGGFFNVSFEAQQSLL